MVQVLTVQEMRPAPPSPFLSANHPMLPADPFQGNAPEDHIRILTERQLNRIIVLAVSAATTARDGEESLDAVTRWLLAPMPNGSQASRVDAATQVDAFWTFLADVLHRPEVPSRPPKAELAVRRCGSRCSYAELGLGEPSLFTASVLGRSDAKEVHTFAAVIAVDEEDARTQMAVKLGSKLMSEASIRLGFDPSEPIAQSLLTDASIFTLNEASDGAAGYLRGWVLLAQHSFLP